MVDTTAQNSFDVCVVGAGPAGASTAIRLARLGHRVCVIEKACFPRPHVGESLTPGIWQAFRVLNIDLSLLHGLSVKVLETKLRWARRTESITSIENTEGIIVDRGRFDTALQDAAIAAGVVVFDRTRIALPEIACSDWRLFLIRDTGRQMIWARYLIDASGRNGFLPGKRKQFSVPTLALCGYLHGEGMREMRVEAISDGWCWGAPVPGGLFSAMTFLDSNAVGKMHPEQIERSWRSRLARAELFTRISSSLVVGSVIARDASLYYSTEPMGRNFVRAGEALFSLDPLSSSGVERAMYCGIAAATVVHTLIRNSSRYELCTTYYAHQQSDCVSKHAAWAANFYSEVEQFADSEFWRKRAVPKLNVGPNISSQPLRRCPDDARLKPRISGAVKMSPTPCVIGDEIEAQTALTHPNLDRPIAFLHDVPITRLLESVPKCESLGALLADWSKLVPRETLHSIANWFVTNEIIELMPMP